jgi:hypothetical protein
VSPGPRAPKAAGDHCERRPEQRESKRGADLVAVDGHKKGAAADESAGDEHLAAIPAAGGESKNRTDRGSADDNLICPRRADRGGDKRSNQCAGYSTERDGCSQARDYSQPLRLKKKKSSTPVATRLPIP